jgi:hypothetical protein
VIHEFVVEVLDNRLREGGHEPPRLPNPHTACRLNVSRGALSQSPDLPVCIFHVAYVFAYDSGDSAVRDCPVARDCCATYTDKTRSQ